MRKSSSAPGRGEDTKQRILDAALQTLRDQGIVGTTARSIAETGGFAPGVLFYHYGSVEDVLVAVARRISAERVERFGQRLASVETLPELVAVARDLHREDMREGQVAVLSQMLAATAGNPDLGRQLHQVFEPWINLVQETLRRVVGDTPGVDLLPTEDLAYAITALFLGLQLLAHLGGDFDRSIQLFDTFSEAGEVVGAFLALLRFGPSEATADADVQTPGS